jgi:2',3'-cyclic-nucleotide 2'-phosphodiesterase (5'-nucleotidase family)
MRSGLFIFISLLFVSCSKTIHVAQTSVEGYEMTDSAAPENTDFITLIAPYKESLEAEMNQVIGQVSERMEKQKPESTLGNWVADALMEMASERYDKHIDFAIQNYGGIRIGSVSPGPLTKGKIFELMPFDNLVSIIEIPGIYVDSLLHRFARSGGWPVSKELRFQISERKPDSIEIGNMPFDRSKTYTIAMPDYIANGGDRMNFLRDLKRVDLDYLIRDALIEFAIKETEKSQNIYGKLDGRIKIQ